MKAWLETKVKSWIHFIKEMANQVVKGLQHQKICLIAEASLKEVPVQQLKLDMLN